MRKNKIIVFLILTLVVFLPIQYLGLGLNPRIFQLNEENVIGNQIDQVIQLKRSDIAGTDLYAEKINAFVAGNESIIKQSLFTNDTNILSQFDSNDPAFYKCNVLLSTSNGRNPGIYPRVLTESEIPSQYILGYNSFVGFLYYDHDVSSTDAHLKADRALEIIKRKFMIDLVMVNVSEPNFFPFIGHYPDWDHFFNELTKNFPMDGYWKALDIDRLCSKEYLDNHHISATFLLLNSIDFFESGFNISTDQINFNIESLDRSFLETLNIEDLSDQFDTILDNFGEAFNVSTSEEDFELFLDIFSSFTLTNNSHYSFISIQYEGLNEGIQTMGTNQYKFDLWKAIGYQGEPLAPSEKIYIALIGAFMSNIEINILCSDIIDATPVNFEFYDYLLEQIALLFYFAGIDFDVETLKDYSFELFWVNEESIKRSFVKPVNLQDPSDVINLLQQLGFQGLNYIPTGIINPIGDFTITYNVSNTEPNLILKKELIGENASFGAFRTFSYNISAENIGNIPVWGIPTPIPLDLNDFFLILTLGNQPLADEVQDTLWEIIRVEYPDQYDSLEDFFNFDEDPKIFYFDTFGAGVYDNFFPNILNFTSLWPFNEKMENVIDILTTGYPQLISALVVLGLTPSEFKDLFMNEDSAWNAINWKLDPGNVISYQVNNYSITDLDSFSPFYQNNFTIDALIPLPEIVSGVSLSETTPEMALSTDNESWVVESVEKYLQEEIEINFIFKNDTRIDFTNNTLESVSIIINFTAPDDLEALDIEIYNFSIEEFQNIDPYMESITNNSWIFSFINSNKSLDWLFYPIDKENYTLLLKINAFDSEQFNISINDLDIEFSKRDININEDAGARIGYGSANGKVQHERRSNSIPLSTYDAASIFTYSYLTNYSSKPGDNNTYSIYFENIGSRNAENITISLLIPGIIQDAKDFILKESNLTYFLPKLAPSENKTLNFTFQVPNSLSIKAVSIVYDNPEVIEAGNSSKIYTLTNEVYLYTPIDYEEHFPYLRTIEISYETNVGNYAPLIGDIFNLTIALKNTGPKGVRIQDLNITMNDHFGDLKGIFNTTLYFEDILYDETQTIKIVLEKSGWKGYYYPPINFIKSSEGRTIQIAKSIPIILGQINFSIIKSVNKKQIEIGEKILVNVELRNTGTIIMKDLRINDIISYSQSDFSLVEGKLVNLIDSLEPGEKVNINYTIRGKKQGLVNLKPASITFYYLAQNEQKSNTVDIKIITPLNNQFYYILLPVLSVFALSIVYMVQIKKYNKKKSEFQRSEKHIFNLSSRDTILKVEHTLRERLSILSKKVQEKNSIDSKGGSNE